MFIDGNNFCNPNKEALNFAIKVMLSCLKNKALISVSNKKDEIAATSIKYFGNVVVDIKKRKATNRKNAEI